MPTRRELLIGGGAALLGLSTAGTGAAQTRLGRKAFHAVGLVDSPDRRPPDVDVADPEPHTLPSGRRWLLAHTGSPTAPPTRSLVCLHGRNNDERFAFDTIGIHRFAQAAGHNLVIASVDGGRSSYWHARKGGPDPLAEIVDDLLPRLPRPATVIGWSMGGYGALLAAQRHPGRFHAVAASSPAVFRRFDDAPAGAFDDAADFAAHDVVPQAHRIGARTRIDCGADDPFAGISDELRRRVPGAVGRTLEGFHDAAFWRWVLPAQLRFLAA